MKAILFLILLLNVFHVIHANPFAQIHKDFAHSTLARRFFREYTFPKIKGDPFAQLRDTKCPVHPTPTEFGTIPDSINAAFQKVEQAYTAALQNVSGATCIYATAVYRDQVIWEFGYGAKNKSNPDIPPDGNTIFRIGSVSKLFPSIATYQMAERGKIGLDDLLSKYAPGFSMINPFPGAFGITFRQVATQQSGLPREAPCVIPCNVTSKEIFSRLKNTYLIYAPYNQPSYSNLGFSLLGRVLENVVDDQFENYVQGAILNPLGMQNTGFAITPEVVSQMAVGYYADGSVAPLIDMGWNRPAGQMYSSGNDLALLMSEFLMAEFANNTNTILGDTWKKQMLSPTILNPDGTTLFGSPWETEFSNSYLVRRKGGNIDGFTALFSVVPELQLGVTALINSQADEFHFSDLAYSILIPAFVQALSANQPPIPSPPNLSIWQGQYSVNGVVVVVIGSYNGNLVFQSPYGNFYLWYAGGVNFQLYIPQGLLPCLTFDLLAFNNNYVQFVLDGQGNPLSFTIPGLFYGITFLKN